MLKKKLRTFTVDGVELVEKKVLKGYGSSVSGRLFVNPSWIGKKMQIVNLALKKSNKYCNYFHSPKVGYINYKPCLTEDEINQLMINLKFNIEKKMLNMVGKQLTYDDILEFLNETFGE